MKNIFGTLLTMIVSLTLLLAVAIAIGFLLHWILPVIDMGIAVLIGLVAFGFTMNFLATALQSLSGEDQDDEGDGKVSEKIYLIEPGALRPRKRKQPRY